MTSPVFAERLAAIAPDPSGRRWLFVPHDQLTDRLGPLARESAGELGIVLVESRERARRRPYHRQRLALEWASQRRFALEQAARGVAVRHLGVEGSTVAALREAIAETGPVRMMEAAERELRVELQPLVDEGAIEVLEHEGWLTTDADFDAAFGDRRRWKMDAFYRVVRRRTGILMDGDAPVGGRWSFDVENRKPWKGTPSAPAFPDFEPGDVEREVVALVERDFADHPGRLDASALPTTLEQARSLWDWACREALPHFGPYEDAMSRRERTLFHTRISALLNLHRLSPAQVVQDVLDLPIPLASQEGFVRQVIGWREFVRHVHRRTDGFRELPDGTSPALADTPDRGAAPSFLGADRPLPPVFWGSASGLSCLDTVVEGVWDEAYGHHITRLMVLSNLATLLDLSPRELTDWFWVGYADAHDWVVEPNVLGMGTFALGELMTTKPYVSGAAYVDRMGDYCADCRFHPKKDCPITPLYWAFLERHAERLRSNPRLAMPYRSLARRDPRRRAADARVFEAVAETLAAGREVRPEAIRSPQEEKK